MINQYGELVDVAVFSLACANCGTPVEIPGRYGFKLKSAGVSSTLCDRCRQESFVASRRRNLAMQGGAGVNPARRRLIPLAAIVIAGLLLVGGMIWRFPPQAAQDALTGSESPSR